MPIGCNYRWYSTDEICTILERFGHIVFAGDESLSHIYAAFNMLLSEDVAHGSLKQWEMTSGQLVPCSCDNQYLNRDCVGYLIGSSEDVYEEGSKGRNRYPYKCSAREWPRDHHLHNLQISLAYEYYFPRNIAFIYLDKLFRI